MKGGRARLLYLVTEDWYFISHWLPMALAAQSAGYEVPVACRVNRHGKNMLDRGFILHPLPWSRMSRGAGELAAETAAVRGLYRRLRPALVNQIALKPVIIGSLASSGLRLPTVNAVAGLGHGFIATGLAAAVRRGGHSGALRLLLNRRLAVTVVQNPGDKAVLERLGIAPRRLALIPGSGVDVHALPPLPEPDGPITVGFAGRVLEDKGVRPLVEAQRILRDQGHDIRLLVAGTPDPSNRASIDETELAVWGAREGVTLLGHVTDIATLWARCHVAALPSRREGLPKALLEAAACARPLVATDVPGCRDVARPGVNSLLVPPDDVPALAKAILTLASDAALRARMAAAGRRLVEETFSSEAIGSQTVALYPSVLSSAGLAPPPGYD